MLTGMCRSVEGADCSPERVSECIKVAAPLLDSEHVFPSSIQDIDHVCK